MTRNARSVLLVAALLLVAMLSAAGCTESGEGSAGCDSTRTAPGKYPGLNVVGDVEQKYWVIVPDSY